MLALPARFLSRGVAVVACLLGCAAAPVLRAQSADADGVWWSYRPLRRPAVPVVDDPGGFVVNPIDAFVLARLRAAGLEPSPPAEDATLIRRVHYDLTGLPPTPEEVAAYCADVDPGKYVALVDRLLASPRYGEAWGRHWLDLVRWAETDSFERDRSKPAAWRYRDWVIGAFDADLPYDRFLTEQLAGDELEDATFASIVATGYHRLGIWDDEPTDPLQAVYDDLDGIVDTTARVTMGISIGCARCHDHKRDPIPTRDYYRLLAFFEGLKPYKVGGGNATAQANYVRRVPVDLGASTFEQAFEEWRRGREEALREAANLAAEARARSSAERRAELAAERAAGLVHHAVRPAGEGGTGSAAADRLAPARIARPVADDFTIAFRFRTDRPGRGDPRDLRWFLGSGLVDCEVPGIVDDFGVSLIGGHVAAGVGNPETFVASPGGLADGRWHHVAFTRHRASGRIALFVDGARVGEAKGGTQPLTSAPELAIGDLQTGHHEYRGDLDDVRIYDRVLDARQVVDLWRGGGFEALAEATVLDKVGAPEAARYRAAVERVVDAPMPVREEADVLCAQEDGPSVAPSFVRERGNAHAQGEPVVPGFPAILGGGDADIVPPTDGETSGRRLALARWLVRDDHPLTWRVAANRIWQHHFGRGLSRTPNDFGRLGEEPTHPELLDWLATELVATGKRWKALHRTILLSGTYRQASAPRADCSAADALNDLFWRVDMRRLSAEELRDSILAVDGTLNLAMGGPSVFPPLPRAVLETASRPDEAWGRSSPADAARRTIYVFVKRSVLMPLLQVFDLADTDTSCPVRFVTTLPTQALTMLNSEFVNEQAGLLAERLRREIPDGPTAAAERVARGLALVTQRQPRASEIERGLALLRDLRAEHGCGDTEALRLLCLVLLNLDEFVYID
ncbi:MAG: DUF1553 domain-containing protein [Planctomycetes bacterium]|nr:DUF1553 domain-containing protein [Planctomycetota bacterium]